MRTAIIKKTFILCLGLLLLSACGCSSNTSDLSSDNVTSESAVDVSADDSKIDNAFGTVYEVAEDGKTGVLLVYDSSATQSEEKFTEEYFKSLAADTVSLYKKYDFVRISLSEDAQIKSMAFQGYSTIAFIENDSETAYFSYGIPDKILNGNRFIKDNKITLYKSEDNAKMFAEEICYLRAILASDFCKNATEHTKQHFSGVYGFEQTTKFSVGSNNILYLSYNTHGMLSIKTTGNAEESRIITDEMLS